MADFDAFESSAPEEDPAAGFIADQDKELAELEDDNFGLQNSGPSPQQQQGIITICRQTDGPTPFWKKKTINLHL